MYVETQQASEKRHELDEEDKLYVFDFIMYHCPVEGRS